MLLASLVWIVSMVKASSESAIDNNRITGLSSSALEAASSNPLQLKDRVLEGDGENDEDNDEEDDEEEEEADDEKEDENGDSTTPQGEEEKEEEDEEEEEPAADEPTAPDDEGSDVESETPNAENDNDKEEEDDPKDEEAPEAEETTNNDEEKEDKTPETDVDDKSDNNDADDSTTDKTPPSSEKQATAPPAKEDPCSVATSCESCQAKAKELFDAFSDDTCAYRKGTDIRPSCQKVKKSSLDQDDEDLCNTKISNTSTNTEADKKTSTSQTSSDNQSLVYRDDDESPIGAIFGVLFLLVIAYLAFKCKNRLLSQINTGASSAKTAKYHEVYVLVNTVVLWGCNGR